MLFRSLSLVGTLLVGVMAPSRPAAPPTDTPRGTPPPPAWAEEALKKEADYIVNCSFTEHARHHAEAQETDDAYGALNVIRIHQRGPDWVVPGEAAMGAIGLMAAAMQIKAGGGDITRYDQVLDRFFRTWILARKQPFEWDAARWDRGGCFERVHYDPGGRRLKEDPIRTGATGQMIAAMWKFYEYRTSIGDPRGADNWLKESWPLARDGGDFIRRFYSSGQRLVQSNSRSRIFWISDSTYSVMALRCLDRWAARAGKTPEYDYVALANNIVKGIRALKDNGVRKGFFRQRGSEKQSHKPTYGDRIDQLCFLPYEADVLDPGEPFAKAISDWWTNGSPGIRMTFQTNKPTDWRYYGTRWRYYLRDPAANRREYRNLYPGPGLQLAKVEWKHARRTGDPVTLKRARQRLEWARGTAHSSLWLGADGRNEADVPGGLVDWRDSTNYARKAGDWERFVDTSAYFIEVVLMLHYGVDTKYVPDEQRLGIRGSLLPRTQGNGSLPGQL